MIHFTRGREFHQKHTSPGQNKSVKVEEVRMEMTVRQIVKLLQSVQQHLLGHISYLEPERQHTHDQGTASMPYSTALLTYLKWMAAKPLHLTLRPLSILLPDL